MKYVLWTNAEKLDAKVTSLRGRSYEPYLLREAASKESVLRGNTRPNAFGIRATDQPKLGCARRLPLGRATHATGTASSDCLGGCRDDARDVTGGLAHCHVYPRGYRVHLTRSELVPWAR